MQLMLLSGRTLLYKATARPCCWKVLTSLPCADQLTHPACHSFHPTPLQAKYGDEAAKQIAARRQREAELAAGGEDANLIPLGVRVRRGRARLVGGVGAAAWLGAGAEDALVRLERGRGNGTLLRWLLRCHAAAAMLLSPPRPPSRRCFFPSASAG